MKSAPARGLLLVVSLANQLVVLGGRLVVVADDGGFLPLVTWVHSFRE